MKINQIKKNKNTFIVIIVSMIIISIIIVRTYDNNIEEEQINGTEWIDTLDDERIIIRSGRPYIYEIENGLRIASPAGLIISETPKFVSVETFRKYQEISFTLEIYDIRNEFQFRIGDGLADYFSTLFYTIDGYIVIENNLNRFNTGILYSEGESLQVEIINDLLEDNTYIKIQKSELIFESTDNFYQQSLESLVAFQFASYAYYTQDIQITKLLINGE